MHFGLWTNHLLSLFPYKVEDEPNKISDQDRTAIKANIVNLMLSSPEQIQKQVNRYMPLYIKGFIHYLIWTVKMLLNQAAFITTLHLHS